MDKTAGKDVPASIAASSKGAIRKIIKTFRNIIDLLTLFVFINGRLKIYQASKVKKKAPAQMKQGLSSCSRGDSR